MTLLSRIGILLLTIILTLPTQTAVAGKRDVIITKLPLLDMMPSRCVIYLYQDSEGEMWYGTEDGLCRDNGHSIKIYYPPTINETNFENNQVNTITEDSIGNIWFGTTRGAYIMNKRSQKIVPILDKRIQNSLIRALYTTSDGSVWLAVDGTMFRFDKNGNCSKDYPTVWNNTSTHVSAIYEDSKGRLWMTLWGGGICRLDKETDTWIYYPWPYDEHATGITEDRSGMFFWIATWMKGIVKFDPSQVSSNKMFTLMLAPESNDERDGAMLYLTQDDNDGSIWVTTNNGLQVFKPENNSLIPVDNEFTGLKRYQMLTQVMRDHNGNIWVGGYNVPSFIVSFNSNNAVTHPMSTIRQHSGHIATISKICHDDEPNLLWVFQERHRLYLYDLKTGQLESEISSLFSNTHNNVGSLYMMHKARKRNGVWIGCHNPSGIYLIQQNNRKISVTEHIDFTGKYPPRAMFEAHDGTLWIGTDRNLFVYDSSNKKLNNVAQNIGTVVDISEDMNGDIIVASRKSHGKSTISRFKNMREEMSREFQVDCTALAVADDTTLWIGTRTGEIYRWNHENNLIALSDSSDYIAMGYIAGLLLDKNNHLWVQTEQRLTEIEPETLNLRNYFVSDPHIGLFNLFPRSFTLLPSGEIMFGGTGGACVLASTPNLKEKKSSKHTYITEIKVDGVPVEIPNPGKELNIAPSNHNIEIEFSCNDHLNAGRIAYAYRFGENDNHWIKLSPGTNKVNINRLKRGKYTFEVKCISGNHELMSGIASLNIYRQPAFYETWWFYSILASVALLILFAINASYNRKKLNRQHKKMEEELIQLKFNFFTNITHELRTPLTLILTPLDSIIRKFDDGPIRRQLVNIHRNANDLMTLINSILNFRRLEVGGEHLTLSKGDAVEFLKRISDDFKTLAIEKKIDFSYIHLCDSCYMSFDIAKLKIIINNLLSNAFKFTPPHSSIILQLSRQNIEGREYAVIKVSDTGTGIEESEISHIFDPFYQASKNNFNQQGSGIGLHVTNEYVKLHHGKIEVTSHIGKGTEFSVYLPVDIKMHEAEKESSATNQESIQGYTEENKDTAEKQLKTVLIIEDNNEFREFMKTELSEMYNVIDAEEANNGEKSAIEHHPDIIISDVMMPGRDGFDLCRSIKNNLATSDIPVILLTARNDYNAEMNAYQSHADAFVQKPFNLQMLTNRIENLIELQRKRQLEFQKEREADPAKLTVNPLDEALLNKILQCIERNITNSGYGIAELSSDVNMSRMNLYRKLQNITGQTPTDFVKTIRLKKAAQMLLENNSTIVEVAYAVGYSSPSYFTRSFKSEFGVTPKQYMEQNRH